MSDAPERMTVSHLMWLPGAELVSSGRSSSALKAEPSLWPRLPFAVVPPSLSAGDAAAK